MALSFLLAKLFGVLYLVAGLSMLLDPKRYKRVIEKVMDDDPWLYFGGSASLVVGLLIVIHHNIWGYRWEVIITLIGWMAIIKGIKLFLAPSGIKHIVRYVEDHLQMIGIVVTAVGAFLSYVGFIAV